MVTLSSGGFKGSSRFSGQGFHVDFERRPPAPYEILRQDAVAIRGASIEAVHQTTNQVKELIRDYIDAHFTSSARTSNNRRRASNASAQSAFYDDLEGKGQYAGLVYSKFGKRDAGGFVDFLLLHVRGGTLRPRRGDWLKLANPKAEGIGGALGQTGFFAMSNSDIFFTNSATGQKLFMLRRYRASGGRPARTELLATLMKQIAFPASLSGVDEIARRRPELFEGHFAAALNARLDGRPG